MTYTVRERDHAHVLMLKGRFLGSIERHALQQTFSDLVGAGCTRLVIDLSETDFVDSTGVGLLVQGTQRLRDDGVAVCLAGMQTRVKNLFVTARLLGRVFDEYPTVDAALS